MIDDDLDLELHPNEAICPVCNLAYVTTSVVASWGACRDCLADGLDRVAAQLVDVTDEVIEPRFAVDAEGTIEDREPLADFIAADGLNPPGYTPSLIG